MILGQDGLLEESMATHSSILARKIPWIDGQMTDCSLWGRKELDTVKTTENTHIGGLIREQRVRESIL